MGHGPVGGRLIVSLGVAVILGVPGVSAQATDVAGASSAGVPSLPRPVSGGEGVPAPKDVAVPVEAAKKAVMDAFGFRDTDSTMFNYSFEAGGPDGRRKWNLNWQMAPKGKGGEGIGASVDADTGVILFYQRWREQGRASLQEVNRDQARETALALIQRLQPEKSKETAEWPSRDLYGPTGLMNYAFSFARVKDGVPFPVDGFRVMVGTDGQIVSYQFFWSDVSFPDPKPALDTREAQSKLAEELAVTAHYIPDPGKWAGQTQVRMVYTANVVPPLLIPGDPPIAPYVLDAATGQWIDGFGRKASPPKATAADPLVPGGPVAPPLRSQPLEQAEAEGIARSVLELPENAAIRNRHYNDGMGEQHPVWNFDFVLPDNSMMVSVTVDALTGEVISLNRGGPAPLEAGRSDGETPEVTLQQARQAAVDFLKRVLPNRVGVLAVPDQPENTAIAYAKKIADTIVKPPFFENYVFRVLHLHNGVIDDLSNVTVSVDKKTGKVTSYFAHFADDSAKGRGPAYPEGQPKPAEEAKKAYLDAMRMTLVYTRLQENPENPKLGPVRLVYLPVSASPVIGWDALSGTWIRTNREPAEGWNREEIRGHWAEKELTAMLQAGVLQPIGGKIRPDEPMTRGDFIAALVKAASPYGGPLPEKPSFRDVLPDHPAYPYVEWALQRRWIDPAPEFHPDEPVTRMAVADLIVRELGYQDLANARGIFQILYRDMAGRPDREVGDAAVVTGLGIMRGAEGRFRPDDPATRAEAAVVLYNLLSVHRNP
ncbi:MAG: S-layer homology domain-containing protein [Kyrpidia sp.]|nr:S-layer homology domain-containing protein [Kyrpidia sp.]